MNSSSRRNCLQRLASHKDTEFSKHSIMKTMENFVTAVQDMEETILVPCRLMDLKVGDMADTTDLKMEGKRAMASSDLYSMYTMVNSVKNQLLWGSKDSPVPESQPSPVTQVSQSQKTHVRRPSTASVSSTNSSGSTISDTDSEVGLENDSGIEGESESSKCNYIRFVEDDFRRHLRGLHHSLKQMTEAARYLTSRYQNDVGGAV
ncbi:mid1-interacting protein 1-B isoform X3 [Bemisia tabaci]|uniref:mid1-interacting protein 1-B isoform X3 n=1 Tax=Bemisia tabaci TaxID=7038 RepID=UPI003B281F16